MPKQSFAAMGVSAGVQDALHQMGIHHPTSVQRETIPPMLAWNDVIAKAPTGTGKTLAFGVPIVEHIDPSIRACQALILAPTRELALQIGEELSRLTMNHDWLKTVVLYGGQNIKAQIAHLKRQPQIIVATPGRLLDHIKRRTVRLHDVDMIVLDEADRMLDMGFVQDVRRILNTMPCASQIAMFSATLSRAVMDISWIYQRAPVEIEVAEEGLDKPEIDSYAIEANGSERVTWIQHLMKTENYQRALVFVNMKQSATVLARKLKQAGLTADTIHGDIRQQQREAVLNKFRTGKLDVLVATDKQPAASILMTLTLFSIMIFQMKTRATFIVSGEQAEPKEGVAFTFFTRNSKDRLRLMLRTLHADIERWPGEKPSRFV